MFQVTVLYNHPEDPAKFDEYYDGVHETRRSPRQSPACSATR